MAAGEGSYYQAVTLIRFDAGESGTFLINNNSVEVAIPSGIGQGTYEPYPEFSVDLPERSGGLDESDLEIDISDEAPFIQELISGYTFAPVKIDVYEYFFDEINNEATQVLHMFSGRLKKAFSNVNKSQGVARITAANSKNRLDTSLGITANVQCSWNLGDNNCKATVQTLTRTVAAVSNTIMEVTEAPAVPSSLFKKGYVVRNDIRILIKEWISGTTFYLNRAVPPSWVGEEVTLVSGCDSSLPPCTETYSNQERFGGIGALMAAYNPVYEEP